MAEEPSSSSTWTDEESTDAEPIDASAVGAHPVALTTRRGNNRRVLAFATVLLTAIGFLVVKGLGNASTYFRTADEAVAQVDTLGTRRFRVEGVVVEDSVRTEKGAVVFLIESNAKQVEVRHEGDPPELFRPNLAVVLEGRFADRQAARPAGTAPVFLSDHLMVKHDENYIEKNSKRVLDYVGKTQS
jgi:cytochrome c-type biogenesis protein CcmE